MDRFRWNPVCIILDKGPHIVLNWPRPILRQDQILRLNQVLYVLCLYQAQISGERLQDIWSSGYM